MATKGQATKQKEAPVDETVIDMDEAPKTMSKKDAEAIVRKYAGINGVKIPELQKAKEVLRQK